MPKRLFFVLLSLCLLSVVPIIGAQDEPPTLGRLYVTETVPAEGTRNVPVSTLLTVVFNQPVVPLTLSPDLEALPNPLTITPAIEGEGRWLNTSIFVFEPANVFAGGIEYTATVDDFQTADGVQVEPYTWRFVTEPAMVLSVNPSPMTNDVGLDEPITIEFSQPMDTTSVESAFVLTRDGDTSPTNGTFTWAANDTRMTFQPNSGLQLDSSYRAFLDMERVQAASGGVVIGSADWSFLTVPYPAYLSTDPLSGEENVGTFQGFVINFASPMNADTIEERITVEPEPPYGVYSYYSTYNNSYRINFEAAPSTAYTVTVDAGMEDVYGNVIDRGLVVTYTTRELEPQVSLQTPGQIGFYNAYNEATELYLAYRNVERVDMNLYSVPVNDLVFTLTDDDYQVARNYIPQPNSLMRQWQIDGTTLPRNQRRYDLMNLGVSGNNAGSCEGALPSRVVVGDIAIVTTEPNPLRARSVPATGEIVDLLYRDYQLQIISGPNCIDSIPWFEVQLRDGSTAWVAESVGEDYLMDVRLAANGASVPVMTNDIEGALAPGVYFLQASSPLTDDPVQHMMMVSTLNLTMKYSLNGALVWVTDVESGQPVANVPVQFYGSFGLFYGTSTTDADGIATITYDRMENLRQPLVAVVQTESHFGVGGDDWTNGIDPYMLNISYDYYPNFYQGYLYTDRPIYRPDQPVYYRGIIRTKQDLNYPLPDFDRVMLQVNDGMGEIIEERQVLLDAYGAFSGTFMLAEDAAPGNYRISVRHPVDRDDVLESLYFDVAEYRLPEYQVAVESDVPQFVMGDNWNVLVEGSYFFGGGVSNADVSYSVLARPYSFTYRGEGRYSFVNYENNTYYYYYDQQVGNGQSLTDFNGQALLDVDTNFENITQSQSLTIEANVTDESGFTVAGRTTAVMHSALIYAGVGVDSYVNRTDEPVNVNVIVVDWDSEPVARQFVDVVIEEQRWSLVQEVNAYGGVDSRYEREVVEVARETVATENDGRASLSFTPTNGGQYVVRVETTDAQDNTVESSTRFWVSSRNQGYVTWRTPSERTVELIADADEYNVGDVARVLVTSPYQGATEALVTVERDGVLSAERLTLTGSSAVIEVPIEADYSPNVFVSVTLMQGTDDNNPLPSIRYGAVTLNVNNEQRVLNINITPDTERAEPGDTVTYTVTTTDYNGQPVSAQVGVGLTDLASLSIAPPNSGAILDAFYGLQRLVVRTSATLTISGDEVTQFVEETIKGGGGGGGGGGIFEIRSDFFDTAYWNATLETDANGQATFKVELPDNLTTWRLDARGLTSGRDVSMLVGQETFDLLSTKPLLLRPVTPRFFVVGDALELAAVVNNNTGTDQTVTAFIEFDGVQLLSDLEQTQTIADGERARLTWQVQVEDVEAVDLTFFVQNEDGQFTDASRPVVGDEDDQTLPVYRYVVPETVGTAGVLRTGETRTEQIQLPQDMAIVDPSVTVNLDTSLAGTTLDGLDYLRNYPHQCTEQTVSRFLPNIVTYSALARAGFDNPTLKAQLDEQVSFGLQVLNTRQNFDGGWGWFSRDDSNPLVTAYALIGLTEARAAGYVVDDSLIFGAQNYLRGNPILQQVQMLGGEDWQFDQEAIVLYALSVSNVSETARLSNLFDNRGRLSIEGQAFLALALHRQNPDDPRVQTLTDGVLGASIPTATGTHWENADVLTWSTNTRTTAVVLKLLVTVQPQSDLIPNVVRYLVTNRTLDAWETTQETAWSVMALTDWMVVSGELNPDYAYNVAINGESLLSDVANADSVMSSQTLEIEAMQLLLDELNNLTFERTDGAGVLYYTAYLDASLPVDAVDPFSRGVSVARQYVVTNAQGEEIATFADGENVVATVGDQIQVRLTIVAPNQLNYVVVDDPIPAGAEPIDPDLLTSTQIGTRPEMSRNDYRFGWGWWWFSEILFRDEKVSLYGSYLPAGTYEFSYEMRATIPGTYHVIPTVAQEFYFPETYGRSSGTVFTIQPAD